MDLLKDIVQNLCNNPNESYLDICSNAFINNKLTSKYKNDIHIFEILPNACFTNDMIEHLPS